MTELSENAKNKYLKARILKQLNRVKASLGLGAKEEGSSGNSPATGANANAGTNAGNKYHVTVSVFGFDVFSTDKNHKSWLAQQKEKIENIKKNWNNFKKAKSIGFYSFMKMLRMRQMRQRALK